MILAGIDEAGYGPVLGPFVVGCSAIEVPGDQAAIPDIWRLLRKTISPTRDRTGKRLHVADSKKVYSPAAGLRELERSTLAFASTSGQAHEALDGLLLSLAGPSPTDRPSWYTAPADELHPGHLDADGLAISCNALSHDLITAEVRIRSVSAVVLYEPEYNRIADATRNKGAIAATALARLLDRLLRDFGDAGLVIVCDRQGGRSHYGPFLRQMFPDWNLTIDREDNKRADYTLTRRDGVVRIIFAEKGETLCLPTALASMIAKYLRERLMGRFNHWWRAHRADLSPTAGYWTDGQRFLQDIAPLRQALGIPDAILVRQR